MLLFGFVLLCTFIVVEPHYGVGEIVTNHLVKGFIEKGNLKSLEPRVENGALTLGWSAVVTKNFSLSTKRYASVNLHGQNITRFEAGWYHLEDYSFNVVDLSNNKIVEITSEMLNDLPPSVGSVYLQHNKINCLRNGVINNKYLVALDLASNRICEIESGALNQLERLELLYLQGNRLHNTEFTATLPRSLEMLYLTNNVITEISTDSFSKLGNLQKLSLGYNNITVIQHQAFNGLQNVIELDLSYNPIEEVEHSSFESTPSLNRILKDGWKLENLADVDFRQSSYKNRLFMIVSV